MRSCMHLMVFVMTLTMLAISSTWAAVCGACGKNAPEDARFCPECGTKMETTVAPQPTEGDKLIFQETFASKEMLTQLGNPDYASIEDGALILRKGRLVSWMPDPLPKDYEVRVKVKLLNKDAAFEMWGRIESMKAFTFFGYGSGSNKVWHRNYINDAYEAERTFPPPNIDRTGWNRWTLRCTGNWLTLLVNGTVVGAAPCTQPAGGWGITGTGAGAAFQDLQVVQLPAALAGSRVNPKDGAKMVLIPAGEFLMGSSDADIAALRKADDEKWDPTMMVVPENAFEPKKYADEQPQRKVYLDAYYLYANEVTVAQYRKFCEATKREMPRVPDNMTWVNSQDDRPVVFVTWSDARAYAQWAGVALPTEAQWEKAARGGDGRLYPWGNAWPPPRAAGNFADMAYQREHPDEKYYLKGYDDGYAHLSPVGAYPANPYGVHDLAGNALEWCSDWYDRRYYTTAPARNPSGPEEDGQQRFRRVVRGSSSFFSDPEFFRAANRQIPEEGSPGNRSSSVGFRCACIPGAAAANIDNTPAPTTVPGNGQAAFAGTWKSDYGLMTLLQDGAKVSGTYEHRKGRLIGTVQEDGRTFVGTWAQEPDYAVPNAGKVVFFLKADGRSFVGSWWEGSAGEAHVWNGRRVDAPG